MAQQSLRRGHGTLTDRPTPTSFDRTEQTGTHPDMLAWLRHYRREDLAGDITAGIIVTVMLVPQGMAYALLAGLPPHAGLYAALLPALIYGLLGSSGALAVGPVAIVSLMLAQGVGGLADGDPSRYAELAITLALMVGVLHLVIGVMRAGFLVKYLSHPVIAGFTSAAALMIGFSQVKHVLGINVARQAHFYDTVMATFGKLGTTNGMALAIGTFSIGVLLAIQGRLGKLLKQQGVPEQWIVPLTKIGPLVVVVVGTLITWLFGLDNESGVKIVGTVPQGLPQFTTPAIDLGTWRVLLPTALTITFVGFVESISIGKALAAKRNHAVRPNQEFLALGLSNIGAAFTGAYPVAGGFGRSSVNYASGANTGLASIITAGLLGLTLMFFTGLFFYLPQPVLGAIVIVAVAKLFDLSELRHLWQTHKADVLVWIITFFAVLMIGIETGIVLGVAASLATKVIPQPDHSIIVKKQELNEEQAPAS